MSAGIVKPHILYPKNPSQHFADLCMLQKKPEFESCLSSKLIDCIRVDGSTDEGPGHDEVQFLATERHLELGKFCSFVTARSSSSSYLNCIKLQNGCLAMAHSNIYIPSTIGNLYVSKASWVTFTCVRDGRHGASILQVRSIVYV